MSDLTLYYNKTANVSEAFAQVKSFVTPENMARFKVKAEVTYDEAAQEMVASGKGFTLRVNFDSEKVMVNLELSLLLRPLRKTILATIEQEFLALV